MKLSVAPIVFVSLLLAMAGALPDYPPPGSTGAGGGECIKLNTVLPLLAVNCGTAPTNSYTNIPCPYSAAQMCQYNKGQDAFNKDKTFGFKGTCAGTTFTFAMADYSKAVGYATPPLPTVTCPDDGSFQTYLLTYYNTTNLMNLNDYKVRPTSLYICPQGFACPVARRRNLLAGDEELKGEDSFAGTEPEVLEFFEECGQYEYEGLLHVTNHIYALAIPSEEAKQANCPYVMMNGLVGNREDPMSTAARKEIKFWRNEQDFEAAFPSVGSLSVGSFFGDEIAKAFHKADVTTPGFSHYDAIKNNCGTFAVNLANELDVKIDGSVTAFVAQRLMEKAGENLLNQFRNSIHFSSLFEGHNRQLRGDVIDGEQLVELVVESSAVELLN